MYPGLPWKEIWRNNIKPHFVWILLILSDIIIISLSTISLAFVSIYINYKFFGIVIIESPDYSSIYNSYFLIGNIIVIIIAIYKIKIILDG
jgi:hypothetical protein